MKTRPRHPKHPRRAEVSFEALLAADTALTKAHDRWKALGYALHAGRMYRCKDGTWTARLVWRHPTEIVSTVTYTVRGFVFQ